MPQCVELNWIPLADGSNATVISPTFADPSGCDMVVVSAAEWAEVSAPPASSPESMGVDAGSVSAAFMWGFGVVILLWSFGYAIGAALGVIRKA